jgi:N-(2-amino-2-carboxyethyl)-L-glutamate synthase
VTTLIAEQSYELIQDDIFLHVREVADLKRFYMKIEGFNPGGSIKIKTALSLIEAAERDVADLSNIRFIESTSGNLGVALSIICAAKNYKLTCVTDPNCSQAAVAVMRALGAAVVVVRRRDANDGFLGSRIAYVRQQLAADPDLFWLNQYANPSNPAAHEQSTAPQVLAEFKKVDYLFIGVGTGGTLMGCANYFRQRSPSTRIIAVDAAGSVSFGSEPATRNIPGIGTSRPPELLDRHAPDEVQIVPEWETVRECRWLARHTGLLTGGSTGSVLAAVRQRGASIAPDSTVVAVAPDLGERYLNSVYDDRWVIDCGLEKALENRTRISEGSLDVLI